MHKVDPATGEIVGLQSTNFKLFLKLKPSANKLIVQDSAGSVSVFRTKIMNKTIALVGRTNVGKSSIFNKLVKAKSSIVSSQEGLTRDMKTAELKV